MAEILIVGNYNNIYLKKYIEFLSRNIDSSIDLLTQTKLKEEKPGYIRNVYYLEKEGNLFYRATNKFFNYPRVGKELCGKYDIINIHYFWYGYFLLNNLFKDKQAKKVLSIWGSDIYRTTKIMQHFQKKVLKNIDIVQVEHEDAKNKFIEIFGNQKKFMTARFGLPINFDMLDSVEEEDLDEFRNKFGLKKGNTSITLGYSSDPGKRHMYMIDEIAGLEKEYQKKLSVIIPLTYGPKGDYRNQVIEYAKEKISDKVNLVLLTEYMSDMEVACLRKITDIMVNIQVTDTFSASMQESLYSGSVVINGSWLPYKTFYDNGILDEKVSNVETDTLANKITEIIDNIEEKKEEQKNNPEIIKELSGWDSNIKNWIKIYKDVLNTNEI